VRPTADRARQALFDILEHRPPGLHGRRVLDLFAGTGAIALEALSRGAAAATVVEQDRDSLRVIAWNARTLGETERLRIVAGDATRLGRADATHDLVFVDPPWSQDLAGPALLAARAQGWIAPAARIVVETAARGAWIPPEPFQVEEERRYGAARFVFLQAPGESR
jgi:16S rRNA (guanine966-N2)-methyltransferase